MLASAGLAGSGANSGSAAATVKQLAPYVSVFRRERHDADRLPKITRERVLETGPKGIDPRRSRRLTDGKGSRLWLIPAAEGSICGYEESGSGACGPVDGFIAGKRVGSACGFGNPYNLVYGFLPDGPDTVTLIRRDGSSREVRVGTNYWTARFKTRQVSRLPRSVQWQSVDGRTRSKRLPVDANFARECG